MINISSQKGFIHPPSLRWWQSPLGNRTQKVQTSNGVDQTSNTAVKANTNQYQAYQYDASGKTINDGTRSYTYNSEGRIATISQGAVSIGNVYNALGQRVQKNSGTSKTYFVYDETGKLISEADNTGNLIREYVYLGNMPVALLSSEKPNAIINVHADHLGTPRAMTDSTNTVLWRWEGDAFGDVQPQLATVKMPLRHAGQYEDREIALFYNYFRYYDPKTGRYIENDPIDLDGGLNRYGYVGSNPLMGVDPKGLIKWDAYYGETGGGVGRFGIGGKIIHFVFVSPCIDNTKAVVNVLSTGIGASGGSSPVLSLGVGKADLYDNYNSINPDVLNGVFSYVGASWFFSGSTTSRIQVGQAWGDMTTEWGKGLHTDLFSVEAVSGIFYVVGSPKWESCCEK